MSFAGTAQLAPLTVAVPLLAAALLVAGSKILTRTVANVFAAIVAAGVTGMCVTLTLAARSAPIVYWMGGWAPRHGVALGIGFVVDPLNGGLAALASLLVTAALVFSWKYFNTSGALFPVLMLAFLAAMCGFSLTGDLFNMFVWFELMGVAAYALTAQKIEEPESIAGAINFAITNSVGAFCALLGVALLYGRTGALNMAQIGVVLGQRPADALVVVAFLLITVGFFVKGAVAPFHFWLDDAHAVAPTPVCVLFSGVMVQLGLYAVARVYWTCFSPALWPHVAPVQSLFIGLGLATAFMGAIMCFMQSHLKRLLAFSTVSHSGMFVCAMGLFNASGVSAAALFIAAHGLIKSALFICAGVVLNRFGSLDERVLHGRGRKTPLLGAVYFAGGLALAGLPPFGISGAKVLFDAAMKDRALVAVAIAVAVASAIDAAAVLRFGMRLFLGIGRKAPPSTMPDVQESENRTGRTILVKANMLGPAAVLLAVSIWIGMSGAFATGIRSAARFFVDQHAYASATLAGVAASIPPAAPQSRTPEDVIVNLAVCAAALLLAFGSVFREKMPLWLAPPISALRRLHTGVFVDYIAYMMVGIAACGVWLVASIR